MALEQSSCYDSDEEWLKELLWDHKKDNAKAEQSDEEAITLLSSRKRSKINHIPKEEPEPCLPDSSLRHGYENANSLDWSPEHLQILFNRSIAECAGLPVEHWNYDEATIYHALREVLAKHSYQSSFYIGATTDVQRRYLGGEIRGSTMPGHCERWLSMIVVHLASGIGARRVETKLINYAKDVYCNLCANVACDSRGVSSRQPAFVYVCVGTRRKSMGDDK